VLLDGQLQADHGWLRRLRWAQRFGLPPLAALVAGAADPLALAERLQLPHRQHQLLAQLLELRRRLAAAAPQPSGAGAWCALLEAPGLAAEAVALALCCGMGPRRPLLRWLLRWRSLKAPCSAADLIAQGWRPGPELGAELRRLRLLRLAEEHC
jgi:poly(A) polymerase